MHRLHLRSPLAGWALPLAEVPDPVFAQGTVGEGLAIDPVEGLLHAPCDGRVAFVAGHRHAVHLHAEGGLVLLMHVGIDTVGLRGEGFEPLVADGAVVEAGQPLLRFDLEGLARAAPSLVTPVLVSEGGRVLERVHSRLLAVGDTLMVVELDGDQSDSAGGSGEAQVRRFTLRFTRRQCKRDRPRNSRVHWRRCAPKWCITCAASRRRCAARSR
jgi:multiphosphoryl transfer protein